MDKPTIPPDDRRRAATASPVRDTREARDTCAATNLFCPVCGHEFRADEIGKKPHCRRCGYLESCCNPD